MRLQTGIMLLAGAMWLLPAALEKSPLQAAGPPEVTSVEGITEYRLENGLKVLLFPDESQPKVTVNLTIFVGSRHEGYGEAGMAHLLEHMVFKGTPDHPQVPKALQDRGAEFNGTTWVDRTNYFETLPATDENLEFAIRLEADRMMNSYIKGEDLKSEMTVVRNEFERGENSPERVLDQRMMATAFEWHNYGKSTIGNRADIERVPVENLKRFYQRFYQPDNAMVVVAGKFDAEKALGYIEKYFGSIPRPKRELDKTYTEEPTQDGERLVTLRRVGSVPLAGALYHIPAGASPEFVAVDVLEQVLTAPPSGRLYKALVETRLASSINGGAMALHDPGVMRFVASVVKGVSAQEVLTKMLDVIEGVAETEITAEEVERAKTHWLSQWEQNITNSQEVAIQLSEWAAQGDWRLMFLYRDRLEKVTPADVRQAAAKYLRAANRTAGVFIPTDEPQRTEVPATPAIAQMLQGYKGRERVAQGEAFDSSPANVDVRTQRVTLNSGVKAAFLPKKTNGETVNFMLKLRYGNEENLKGLVTAARAMPVMMLRGTEKMSRQQIDDVLKKNRAELGLFTQSPGELTVTGKTQRKFLPVVLDVMQQVLREPSFPENEFAVLKQEQKTQLERGLQEPQSLAMRAIQRALSPYPPEDVRYVATLPEAIERINQLKLEEITKVYHDYLGSANGELVVIGDFDTKQVESRFNEILDGWKAKMPYARIEQHGDIELKAERVRIDTPDKPNAVYVAGSAFPLKDTDTDFAPLTIGNFVLGSSGLSSRLGDRLRQKEGLSYGVGSRLEASAVDSRSAFMIFAIMNVKNSTKADKYINEEVNKILDAGITSQELKDAQTGFLEELKVGRADDGVLSMMISESLEAGRTMEYYANLETQVKNLTTEQVHAALKKYIQPDRIVQVIAGDLKKADAAANGTDEKKAGARSK